MHALYLAKNLENVKSTRYKAAKKLLLLHLFIANLKQPASAILLYLKNGDN
jgi:hypothetical protein